MEKLEVLREVQRLTREGVLTQAEVLDVMMGAPEEVLPSVPAAEPRHGAASTIFYGIGGVIVIAGISILVFQNWGSLSDLTKIVVTFGAAIMMYVLGTTFWSSSALRGVATTFHFIAAVLFPLGINVTLNVMNVDSSPAINSVIAALLTFAYWITWRSMRNDLFLVFTIAFATNLYYSLTGWLFLDSLDNLGWLTRDFFAYRSLISGLAYILIGRWLYLSKSTGDLKERSSLISGLYGFGILGILGSALALSSWSKYNVSAGDVFWDVVYPVILASGFYLSTRWKSKAFLVFSSIFLMIYIVKLTARYFSDTLGWPVALIIAGLGLIGVGFLFVYLNKRYIKNQQH